MFLLLYASGIGEFEAMFEAKRPVVPYREDLREPAPNLPHYPKGQYTTPEPPPGPQQEPLYDEDWNDDNEPHWNPAERLRELAEKNAPRLEREARKHAELKQQMEKERLQKIQQREQDKKALNAKLSSGAGCSRATPTDEKVAEDDTARKARAASKPASKPAEPVFGAVDYRLTSPDWVQVDGNLILKKEYEASLKIKTEDKEPAKDKEPVKEKERAKDKVPAKDKEPAKDKKPAKDKGKTFKGRGNVKYKPLDLDKLPVGAPSVELKVKPINPVSPSRTFTDALTGKGNFPTLPPSPHKHWALRPLSIRRPTSTVTKMQVLPESSPKKAPASTSTATGAQASAQPKKIILRRPPKTQQNAPGSTQPKSQPSRSAPASAQPKGQQQRKGPGSTQSKSEPSRSAPASAQPKGQQQRKGPASMQPKSEPSRSAPASAQSKSQPPRKDPTPPPSKGNSLILVLTEAS